jgi:hypothetical protein
MPRFDVCVTTDVTMSQVLSIVAEDEASARAEALENYDPSKFENDDNLPQDVYVSWSERNETAPKCRTRADLMLREAWRGMETDTSGNPCVWLNFYADEENRTWTDTWSCQCDDDGSAPYHSDWIGPQDEAEIILWENLPDA